MFQALKIRLQTGQDINWYDICGKKKAREMVLKSLHDGMRILKFLNSFNKPVFALPGNWDWTGDPDWNFLNKSFWKKYLIKNLKNVRDCHKKLYGFQDLIIVGHGITSGPEFPEKAGIKNLTKREIAQKKKEYKKEYFIPVNKIFRKAGRSKKLIIFLSHNVPYNTKLDKIINPSSPMNGKHMGSYLARDMIIKHSPLVCIGGHMHEHFGKTRLGKTICVNAGFGSFVNTVLEIKDGKIKKLEFIRNSRKLH